MIEQESEKKLDVPVDVVWNWVKKLENITSLIPRVEIVEKITEKKAKVKGNVFRILNPPEEIIVGEAETVETNEEEKYTRSITEGRIFRIETFLKCGENKENQTKIQMKAKAELKGFAGTLLEKIIFIPIISDAILTNQIDEILNELGRRLEKYMRKKWKNKLEKKIKKIEQNYSQKDAFES